MPLYEYLCQSCQEHIEILQKISDKPKSDCPKCNTKNSLTKNVTAPNFRLKGGGWYETDFKTGDKKKNLVNSDKKQSEESQNKSLKKAKSATQKSSQNSKAIKKETKK